jgi:hypothetical protein
MELKENVIRAGCLGKDDFSLLLFVKGLRVVLDVEKGHRQRLPLKDVLGMQPGSMRT